MTQEMGLMSQITFMGERSDMPEVLANLDVSVLATLRGSISGWSMSATLMSNYIPAFSILAFKAQLMCRTMGFQSPMTGKSPLPPEPCTA